MVSRRESRLVVIDLLDVSKGEWKQFSHELGILSNKKDRMKKKNKVILEKKQNLLQKYV